MKLVKSSVEYLPQEEGLEGIYKQIERCTRVSYKSEDKITEDSAKKFVDMLIKSKHYAGLEHGTVYLYFKECCYSHSDIRFIDKYSKNEYSKVIRIGCDDDVWPDGTYHDIMGGEATGDSEYVITTNYRVLVENDWLDDLQFICSPTEYHEKRYSFKFTTDIGVCRELLRHRKFSFINESTRYCNYSKDKFDNQITFIEPHWLSDDREFKTSEAYSNAYELFCSACEEAEGYYNLMVEEGFKPQDARQFLPLATKTELCMTGFVSDWKYLLDLRLYGKTGTPHPDMVILMKKLQKVIEGTNIKVIL